MNFSTHRFRDLTMLMTTYPTHKIIQDCCYLTILCGFLALNSQISSAEAAENESESSTHIDALPIIEVTAERHTANEGQTAIGMSVRTGEDLERQQTDDTLSLVQKLPNMHMIRAGHHSGASLLSMRGVTPFMEGEQPIGFFVDGIYQHTIDSDLLDVARVEVLRGPQSTLYGRNTEAGAVNIITRDPEPVTDGKITLGFGNYAQKSVQAVTGGALWSDDFSYRAALSYQGNDGYFEQDQTGASKIDEQSDFSGRLKLRYNPSKQWDVILGTQIERNRDGSTGFAPLTRLYRDPHITESDYIGTATSDIQSGSAKINYQGDGFQITSISAYRHENKKEDLDVDFTANDQSRLRTLVNHNRFTQEIRLSSPENETDLQWLAGLYYFNEKMKNEFDYEIRGMMTQKTRTKQTTENIAGFGQLTMPLGDQFAVTAGLRYDHETKDVDNTTRFEPAVAATRASTEKMTFDAWLPKVSLSYKPTDQFLAYASYGQGYKSGGFNNLSAFGKETYDAEYTRNYEIGAKFDLIDGRLRTRAAAFWIDWTNQQVEEIVLTQSRISNAGTSVSRGVEAEIDFQATEGLRLNGSIGWNDAHFTDYKDGSNVYDGNRPANAPALTYAVGADYQFENGLYARADWQGNGGFYYDSANKVKEKAYGTLNLKAGYEFDDYEVSLWMKNVTNQAYAVRAFDAGSGRYVGLAGEPRTFGINLTARW